MEDCNKNKMKPIDYYNDNQGSYQYVPLKKIIDDFFYETMDDDSFIKHTKRVKIIKSAKECLMELHRHTFNEAKAVELSVPENLALPLPHNFVSLLRISLVDLDTATNSYRLKPLDRNGGSMNIATGYLQDHKYKILFDQNGCILKADGNNNFGKPFKLYEFETSGTDSSQVSKVGEYTLDERGGAIMFSSNLADKDVVIEYLSDGLYTECNEGEISVHKDLIEVLKNWIYFKLIQYKRHVPQNEKHRALQRYKTTRHEARLDRANINIQQMFRVVRK